MILSNYSPISLLPVIDKIMDLIINSNIFKYLESSKLIHDRQYGFHHERSTADLTSVILSWSISLEFYGESQVITLTFQKLLIQCGAQIFTNFPMTVLPRKLCAWFSSFLSNWRKSVVYIHLLSTQSILEFFRNQFLRQIYSFWTITTYSLPNLQLHPQLRWRQHSSCQFLAV